MSKNTKKIILILMLIFIVLVVGVSAFEYLIKMGKFTSYVERRIDKQIGGTTKIESVYVDLMSGVILNNVTFQWIGDGKDVGVKFKSLSCKYKLTDLFSNKFKNVELLRPEINVNLNVEDENLSYGDIANEDLINLLSGVIPANNKFYVEDFKVTNGTLKVNSKNYLMTSSRIHLSSKEVQPLKPFEIISDGVITFSGKKGTTKNTTLFTEFNSQLEYNHINHNLTIAEDSKLTVSDVGDFVVKGKVESIFDGKPINCELDVQGDIFKPMLGSLKGVELESVSPDETDGKQRITFNLNGDIKKISSKLLGFMEEFTLINNK